MSLAAVTGEGVALAQERPTSDQNGAASPGEAPAPNVRTNTASAVQEVIIVGNRYQAAAAQIKASNTINVLSASDLEHTAVHNVAEALGLLPGVNVMQTGSGFIGGVDAASRGEGMYVSLRGLNSEYNVNLINGVDVAQGQPYTRGVQLSLLPPSGLQTVVLNLTSTPDMDGDAIGGTVDFHTPSAFDYAGAMRGSLTVGARAESRAIDYGKNGLGYNIAADGSTKFGRDGQFGLYVSGFYDIRNFDNSLAGGVAESGCCDNGWDFAVQNGGAANVNNRNNATGFDPEKNLLLTGVNFGVSSGHTERYGGNAAFDWRPNDTTSAYVKLTYARANTEQNTHNSQVVADGKLDGSSGQPIGTTGLYQPILGGVSLRYWYETNPETATLGTAQIGGEEKFGNLSIAPNAFFSWGEDNRPDHIEVATRINPSQSYGGTTLFTFSNGYPQALLTPAMFGILSNVAAMPTTGGSPEKTSQFSGQQKAGIKVDLKYTFDDGFLKFVKFGAKYQDSWRNQSNVDYQSNGYGPATTFGGLGIIDGSFKNVYPGQYNYSIPEVNQSALFKLYNSLTNSPTVGTTVDDCGGLFPNNYLCNTQKATEAVSSVYMMGSVQLGSLEVIPGIRYEHTDIQNTFFLIPTDASGASLPGSFKRNEAIFDEVLPSIFFNYRPDARTVYRAAVWTSYTRPPFLQLGGGASSTVSNSGGIQLTTISIGNPNLKPITAVNYDVSAEWDSGAGGHLMIAAYYKDLHDYIYDYGSAAGVQSTSAVTGATIGTITTKPSNGGIGRVYGVEIQARQKFQGLPAPFDGLGVGGNATRQFTRVDLLGDRTRMDQIQNAPGVLFNGQLFYEKGAIAIDLSYNYTGAYVSAYDQLGQGASWDDLWVRPVGRLDLHAGYSFPNRMKLDLSVSNLLKENSYWAHVGKASLVISDIVNTGETALLNLTYKY